MASKRAASSANIKAAGVKTVRGSVVHHNVKVGGQNPSIGFGNAGEKADKLIIGNAFMDVDITKIAMISQ